jgi:hypothetical protein
MDEQRLRAYAELTVRIGLNLQPGQRLLIVGPSQWRAPELDRTQICAAAPGQARGSSGLWGDGHCSPPASRMRRAIRSTSFRLAADGAVRSREERARSCRSMRTIPIN